MTRQTSIEAYDAIKENGLLSGLQFQVYDALYKYGPATQQELWYRCFQETQARNIMPRFAELSRMGIVDYVEKRPCSITKRKCLVWDVTDRLPIKPAKKQTKDQLIKELQVQLAELRSVVEQMRANRLRQELF